jgi:hypothetical protein
MTNSFVPAPRFFESRRELKSLDPVSHRSECCLLPFATELERKKRRQNADRRGIKSCTCRRSARPPGRARLSASCRGSRQGDSWSPRLSVRPCFQGQSGALDPMDRQPGRRSCASPRVLPAPENQTKACPHPVSTSHAGHNAGRLMPDAARERVVSPPAGTALAPLSGLPSAEGVLH